MGGQRARTPSDHQAQIKAEAMMVRLIAFWLIENNLLVTTWTAWIPSGYVLIWGTVYTWCPGVLKLCSLHKLKFVSLRLWLSDCQLWIRHTRRSSRMRDRSSCWTTRAVSKYKVLGTASLWHTKIYTIGSWAISHQNTLGVWMTYKVPGSKYAMSWRIQWSSPS